MRFAVVGASGRIGSRVVAEALSRGHAVTAVVRDVSSSDLPRWADRTPGPVKRSLSVVGGDVFEPGSVAAAVTGAEIVVSAVGHAASLDDRGYYVRAAGCLVEAVRGLGDGAPRLFVAGGFGSLVAASGTQMADAGGFPDHAAPEIVGQRDALAYLRTVSDVRWTYFAPPPGGIRPGERTGVYRTARDHVIGEPRDSRVSMEDFAVAMVDEAERGEHPFACLAVAN